MCSSGVPAIRSPRSLMRRDKSARASRGVCSNSEATKHILDGVLNG